ncbi:NAD(P)-dependent dehydrogenase (short-subunit alcohol dehydrogenase family) [Nonomuraea thailandensis]|uniref:NAD(P)-dependent dehydrogenase (Short-subunit alcohol dehydrogenase family) n=1 Tax=Nonomuraea thailandensis TaxID=1188745 RepID=A0A9X2KCR8_9ACTN|nr:hypothetical protein [Nonomuraea thailandensis]MCP2365336.1 NAD(P)-dependent dehydrogenase (short-subunit alcohol dehydrogenase family) [Nonomuraea thailandensis]
MLARELRRRDITVSAIGASSEYGRLTAVALARAGHTVVLGMRRFRSHLDPGKNGSDVVSIVADRVRAEFSRRVGIEDLLSSIASL